MTVVVQEYIIHLSNGMIVIVPEEYDKPFKDGVIAEYEKADDNHLFTFGNGIDGLVYVLKKNIVCIETGNVTEGLKWSGSKN